MIAVVLGNGRWRLIGRTGRGADVLATGPLPEPAGSAGADCQPALERLREAGGEFRVTTDDDRHFGWVLRDGHGRPIAQSPPVHRDPAQCRDAFQTARRAADAALADHYHPMADAELSSHDHPLADATTG